MTDPARVLVVIVNYKTARWVEPCLRALEPERALLPNLRVSLVENASGESDALGALLDCNPGYRDWVDLLVADRNGGFAAGNNVAIRAAMASADPPDFIHLLNADTEVHPGALASLVAFLRRRPDVGLAGGSFCNADGSDWPLAFRFPSVLGELERGLRFGPVSRLLKNRVVPRVMPADIDQPADWLCGASLMIRRAVVDAIGLMDEGYFLYYEETDFCLRALRAGWPSWYVPSSRVMHVGGQSTDLTVRDRRPPRMPAYIHESRHRYFLKHHGTLRTALADVAFGGGFALWRLRRFLQRKPDVDPPHLLGDFWRQSVFHRNGLTMLAGHNPANQNHISRRT